MPPPRKIKFLGAKLDEAGKPRSHCGHYPREGALKGVIFPLWARYLRQHNGAGRVYRRLRIVCLVWYPGRGCHGKAHAS
jgi:hypothetical protein